MIELDVSVVAAVLAAAALGWNIYRDIVSKRSRVKIAGSIMTGGILGQQFEPDEVPHYIVIYAVNHGPADTSLSAIEFKIKKKSFFEKQKSGIMTHDYTNPLSDKLPCELKVAKRARFIFPFDSDCFLKMELSDVWISDVFGNTHRMTTRNLKKLRSRWCAEFKAGARDVPKM